MRKKIIILIIISLVGVLVVGFFVWNYLQTIERKYRACLRVCDIESSNIDNTEASSLIKFTAKQENEKCQALCREKYGK